MFFPVFLSFSLLYLRFAIYVKGWQCVHRACYHSLFYVSLRALFHGFEYMFTTSEWPCNVCPCLCVVYFSCSACFFLLFYVLVLILWLSFDWIRRSVGVFTRVYVDRVSFLCTVRVCSNPLLLCCLSLVHFATFSILLHFASMDLYSYSVWMRFLQVVVFVCKLVAMYFLSRCCVFFRLSLLFLFIFVIFSIYEGVTVLESRVLLFTLILSRKHCFQCFECMLLQ